MAFALVQINPFAVVTLYPPSLDAPNPVVWPDGAASHAVSAPFVHGNWALVNVVYTPAAPNAYTQLVASVPSFDGATLTFTQTWTSIPLPAAQADFAGLIDLAAASAHVNAVMANQQLNVMCAVRTMMVIETRNEAVAIANLGTAAVLTNYPMIGAIANAMGVGVGVVVSSVLSNYAAWVATAAKIEGARISAQLAVANATSVTSALTAYNAVAWPPG